jgi:penicillin-binding protein 1A
MEKVYADTSLGIDKGYFRRPKKLRVNLDCPHRPESEPDSLLVNPEAIEDESPNFLE